MRFFYRLTQGPSDWQATTQPPGDTGRGDSPAAAVLDLREVLTLRLQRPGLMRSGIGNVTIDLEPIAEALPGHLLEDEEDARPTKPIPESSGVGRRAPGLAQTPEGSDGA